MKKSLLFEFPGWQLNIFFLLSCFIFLFWGFRSCSISGNLKTNSEKVSRFRPKIPSGNEFSLIKITTLALSKAPKHVRKLIRHLKTTGKMKPPTGYKGGRVFRNREGILPKGKTYYEFDVHPYSPYTSRGAERVVVDQKKEVFYYTRDHYQTFAKIE